MRLLPAIVPALLALTALTACSTDGPPAGGAAPTPTTYAATWTADALDGFLTEVGELGWTCRDALPDDADVVACTRPVAGGGAPGVAAIRVRSDDGVPEMVAMCVDDVDAAGALRTAFLPDLPDSVPLDDRSVSAGGEPTTPCFSPGVVLGEASEDPLARVPAQAYRNALTSIGYTCERQGPTCETSVPGAYAGSVVVDDDTIALVLNASERSAGRRAVDDFLGALGVSDAGLVGRTVQACEPGDACERPIVDGLEWRGTVEDGGTLVRLTAATVTF